MRILNIVEGTSVDGPGLRTSIYFSGCTHKCEGCHNPQSWDFEAGKETTLEEVMKVIEYNGFPVTFSGGDPFFQAEDVTELAREIKSRLGKNIWCYTGFVYESLIQDDQRELLEHLDVLVDGPFIQKLHDPDLLFRGSSNQRIINVQASLYSGTTVLWKPDVEI